MEISKITFGPDPLIADGNYLIGDIKIEFVNGVTSLEKLFLEFECRSDGVSESLKKEYIDHYFQNHDHLVKPLTNIENYNVFPIDDDLFEVSFIYTEDFVSSKDNQIYPITFFNRFSI